MLIPNDMYLILGTNFNKLIKIIITGLKKIKK